MTPLAPVSDDSGAPAIPPDAPPTGLLARHGAAMARHARTVALTVVVLAVAGYLVAALGVGGPSLFSRLELGDPVVPGEAAQGRDLLAANDPTGASIQGVWRNLDPQAPEVQQEIADAHADLVGISGVVAVTDASEIGQAAVSSGGDSLLTTVLLDSELTTQESDAAHQAVTERLDAMTAAAGSTVEVVSSDELVRAIKGQVEKDLKKGEGISLPLSLLIMVLIFGGFAAAGVPLVGAIAAIAGGLTTLLAFTCVMDLDITVVNVVTVLGLGLSIDYSLLMVSRYREQMHEIWDLTEGGHERVPPEVRERAMAVTMSTAGRTVLFSGVTVAVAVTGLMFIDMRIIRSVGAGAVSVVVIAVVVATTFVPALLVLGTRQVAGRGMLARLPGLRRRAGAFDHAPSDDGAFARWARRVQRRPWLAFGSVAVALVVLSLPAWRMTLVNSGVELLPASNPNRVAYEQIRADFPQLSAAAITVVAEADQVDALAELAPRLSTLPGVTRIDQPQIVGQIARLDVHTETGRAEELVQRIRNVRPDQPQTWVTGSAAVLVDFTAQLRHDVWIALLFVVVATFVLLFLLTGSVLIPIKALVMNLLSLGATFGLLVVIFQDGHLSGLLGFTSTGGIEATIPVIIFAFAFGLSMDYEVFLLARIKEFHDAGLGNNDSVRLGLQRTGRIITSAALLIVVVFAGFVLGDLLAVKQTGVALALAVIIDATLVRMILVPATMTLLGDWNWWAPGPLRRLHGRLGITH